MTTSSSGGRRKAEGGRPPASERMDAVRQTVEPDVVLEVKDLRVHYGAAGGAVIAVNGIDFGVRKGEILGLVGESGSGKSTVAMAILRLLQPPGRIVSGAVRIMGTDMLALTERQRIVVIAGTDQDTYRDASP